MGDDCHSLTLDMYSQQYFRGMDPADPIYSRFQINSAPAKKSRVATLSGEKRYLVI
jgi:hypothetical protein